MTSQGASPRASTPTPAHGTLKKPGIAVVVGYEAAQILISEKVAR